MIGAEAADPARGGAVRTALGLAWRAHPTAVCCHISLTAVGAAVPVVAAWLTKLLLEGLVAPSGDERPVVRLAVALGAAGAVAVGLAPLGRYVRLALARRVGLLATDRLFAAVNRFDGLARFEDPGFVDRLRLATQSGGSTPGLVLDAVFGVAQSVLTIAGFVGVLFALSPTMTAIIFLAAVPGLAAELWTARRNSALLWEIGPTQRLEAMFSSLLSGLDAAKEVRLFGLASYLRARLLAERRRADAARRHLERRELLVEGGLGLMSAGVAALLLVWTVLAAQRGDFSVGDVALALAAVAGVQAALGESAREAAFAHGQLLLFDHYRAVLEAPPDLPRAAAPRAVSGLRQGIELRDVWFRYSDEHPWTLREVNLTIPRGHTVALVGRNGAGKSTLVKLLCRFYDPTKGNVLWDGTDLRDMDPAELRGRIGAVFQDFMHYEMSAAENVGLGDLDLMGDRERIRTAARRADVDDVLEGLPNGYDTLLTRMFLGEPDDDGSMTGVVLSGGQWQRVALARSFLRDRRDLVILDEPSAGLDAEAEHEIHRRMRDLRVGRTTILVSHRLSAVRHADAIAVFDKGRLVEHGSHEELIARAGTYARLFTLQAKGYAQAHESPGRAL